MMMLFSLIMGLLPAALKAGVLLFLVRRRQCRRFPWFFVYILYSTVAEPTLV
jgi:hypothetical protein